MEELVFSVIISYYGIWSQDAITGIWFKQVHASVFLINDHVCLVQL